MAGKDLPRFVIYQPNEQEFVICLELGKKFVRWSSSYLPSPDVRYKRAIVKIADLPAGKLPTKGIIDKGTYTTKKSATREVVEKKLREGIRKRSFSFIFQGKKFKGKYAIKQTEFGVVIKKFKDKFAIEEDVLAGDLSRTISTMVPDYDARKIKLNKPKRQKKAEQEEAVIEELTADKTIGNVNYNFAFYTSEDEQQICLVTNEQGAVLVLSKIRNGWVLLNGIKGPALKRKDELVEHAQALSDQ